MHITEVKVFPINEEKLKAFVSVVFDSCFMVNDIKVIRGRDGLFISMPSRKKKNGEFKDVAHPLNNQTRRMIEDEILGEYERVLAERKGETPSARRPTAKPAAKPVEPAVPAPSPPAAAAADVEPPVAAVAAVEPPVEAAPPAPEKPRGEREVAASSEAAPSGGQGPAGQEGKTLEEIEELHLRDSFWTVS